MIFDDSTDSTTMPPEATPTEPCPLVCDRCPAPVRHFGLCANCPLDDETAAIAAHDATDDGHLEPLPRGREPFDASRHLLPPGAELPDAYCTDTRAIYTHGLELHVTASLPGYGPVDAAAGRPIPRTSYRIDAVTDEETGESATPEQIGWLLLFLGDEGLWSEIDEAIADEALAAHEQRCERAMEGL